MSRGNSEGYKDCIMHAFQPSKTFHLCTKGYKTSENRYMLKYKCNETEYFSTK